MTISKSKRSSTSKACASSISKTDASAETTYQQLLPLALELNEDELVPFRSNTNIIYHNVKKGFEAVWFHQHDLKQFLTPSEIKHISELPKLALALTFASSQAVHAMETPATDVSSKLLKARKCRLILLKFADSYAQIGLLPESDVTSIKKGKGQLDLAQDCIDLAALFRRHANKLKGKSPIDTQFLLETSSIGTELITLLKPVGASSSSSKPKAKQASNVRDRFWTLLLQRHEILWKAGAILFGKKVNEHVPPLQSRTVRAQKRSKNTED